MLEMQAVLGRIQLRRMSKWTTTRARNAKVLTEALLPFAGSEGSIRLPRFACASCPGSCDSVGCVHARYKFYVYVRAEKLASGWTRDRIVHEINSAGVPCYQGSCSEVYLEKAFDGTGWRPEYRLLVARELGETSLVWLVHPTLTDAEMQKSAQIIVSVLTNSSG
jgi:dTDP-4-amino-4,6-dideoxygalactose transaminase